jgi:hypothetical protein
MIYILEYFSVSSDGRCWKIEHERRRAKTIAHAEDQAKSSRNAGENAKIRPSNTIRDVTAKDCANSRLFVEA